jgi:hypothetical protein
MKLSYLQYSKNDTKDQNNSNAARYCHGSDSDKWCVLVEMKVSYCIAMNGSHIALTTLLFRSCGNPAFPSW